MSVRTLAAMSAYRRLFAARTISNVGNGMAPVALAFGVLGLPEGSPTALSIVLAAQAIPLVIFLPIGGVIADRIGRPLMIGLCDMLLFAVIATIGLLFLTDNVTIPLLVGLQVLVGILNGLWYPAYPGLISDVVPEEHLQPANAYLSVGSNGSSPSSGRGGPSSSMPSRSSSPAHSSTPSGACRGRTTRASPRCATSSTAGRPSSPTAGSSRSSSPSASSSW